MGPDSVNDKGKRKVGEEESSRPAPKLATVCVVCGAGFDPYEKACYIRQCRCFYHRRCFKTAFEESTSDHAKCVRCSRLFYWPDVRKVYISKYDGLFILAYAMACGVVAYPIAQEYEHSSEEDESDEEYEDGSGREDGSDQDGSK